MEALWSRPSLLQNPWPAPCRRSDRRAATRRGRLRVPDEVDPSHRHFDLAQGGGALLDLGIYPVQLSTLVFGAPDRITAEGNVGSTGVDEDVAALLHHIGGGLSVLKGSIRPPQSCTGRIAGSEGLIEIPAFMHCPNQLTLISPAGREVFEAGWEGEGLWFEIDEVNRCLSEGLTENPRTPAGETLLLQEILDEIRSQLDVVYPGEDFDG